MLAPKIIMQKNKYKSYSNTKKAANKLINIKAKMIVITMSLLFLLFIFWA